MCTHDSDRHTTHVPSIIHREASLSSNSNAATFQNSSMQCTVYMCALPVALPCDAIRSHQTATAWGGHYTIQAVAFDLLIAFSLLFPQHTRLPLCHHSSCNKIINNNILATTVRLRACASWPRWALEDLGLGAPRGLGIGKICQ